MNVNSYMMWIIQVPLEWVMKRSGIRRTWKDRKAYVVEGVIRAISYSITRMH